MTRPARLAIVLFLPTRRPRAASTALVWGPILNADLIGFIPAVFLVISPTCFLFEEVPDPALHAKIQVTFRLHPLPGCWRHHLDLDRSGSLEMVLLRRSLH